MVLCRCVSCSLCAIVMFVFNSKTVCQHTIYIETNPIESKWTENKMPTSNWNLTIKLKRKIALKPVDMHIHAHTPYCYRSKPLWMDSDSDTVGIRNLSTELHFKLAPCERVQAGFGMRAFIWIEFRPYIGDLVVVFIIAADNRSNRCSESQRKLQMWYKKSCAHCSTVFTLIHNRWVNCGGEKPFSVHARSSSESS